MGLLLASGASGVSGASNINLLSQLTLIGFISSNLPSNVQAFLLASSSGGLRGILPDWGKIDESDYVCFLDDKFRKADFDCLTYNNIRHIVFITFLVVLLKCFLALSTTIILYYEKKDVIPEERFFLKKILLLLNRQMGRVVLTKILFAL